MLAISILCATNWHFLTTIVDWFQGTSSILSKQVFLPSHLVWRDVLLIQIFKVFPNKTKSPANNMYVSGAFCAVINSTKISYSKIFAFALVFYWVQVFLYDFGSLLHQMEDVLLTLQMAIRYFRSKSNLAQLSSLMANTQVSYAVFSC